MTNTLKTTVSVILVNLIIGNGILYFGGKSSFGESVNWPLMIGMTMACTLFYILFFSFSNYETYSKLKLVIISILSCVMIIFLGNLLALLIKEPSSELLNNLAATIFMGIMGNIIFFPVSLVLGLLNYGIITYLKLK